MNIITRFAPSPTGLLHAGNYRTALFSYIFARQNNGQFILRIEDSDRNRSKKEYEDNIIESLKWLNLSYDSFYRQSDRANIHRTAIQRLIDTGFAYISKEVPKEEGERTEVIRFKNPNKKVSFVDLIRGKIETDTTEQGDFVIARGLDEPVFHLAVVVDDNDMGVTHIVRGEDHISNTARHILIYEAIGYTVPKYAHVPLLMSPDRTKLSKRKGALPITEYRSQGYLPEAVVNYLAMLGWNPGDERELFTLADLIKLFNLEKVQKAGAIFDIEKLNWYNRQYIIKLSSEKFAEVIKSFMPTWIDSASSLFVRILPTIQEKIVKLGEVGPLLETGGELAFIRSLPDFPVDLIPWKKNPSREVATKHLVYVKEKLSSIESSNFTSTNIKNALWDYAEKEGRGDVLWPLRVALTGQEKSPDPFVSAYILGREEALRRIDCALDKLR